MLLSNSIGMPLYKNYVTGLTPQIDDMKKRLAAETDTARQATLRTQISVAENNRVTFGGRRFQARPGMRGCSRRLEILRAQCACRAVSVSAGQPLLQCRRSAASTR